MKTRTLLMTAVLLTVVMVVIAGGSKTNIPTDEAIEVLSGSWVNQDYDTAYMKVGRLKMNLNGTISIYERTTSDYPVRTGNFTIDKAWKDPQGNILCNITVTDIAKLEYRLVKKSNSGDTLEYVTSHTGYDDYPKEIDPNNAWYNIFYCQEYLDTTPHQL
jgi:hypothetical protein